MDIEHLNTSKIRITLTHTEISKFFGSYEKIDYNDPVSRRTLHDIIKNILPNNRFLQNCKQLNIEVHPKNGGCVIDLIKKGKEKPIRLYPPKRWRLDFFDTESMLSAICALYCIKRNAIPCTLYKSENGYHAVISSNKKTVENILCYCFADSSKLAVASLEEYAKPICRENTVEIIGSLFSKHI